jgi:hemoglobin
MLLRVPRVAAWASAVFTFAALACGAPKPPAEPAPPESDAAAEPPPPPPPPAPSLYQRIGKKEALAGVVDELMGNVLADNRIAKAFEKARKDKARAKQLQARLVAELCVVAGGGDDCAYDGKSMKDAHTGMSVTSGQWDAFIEDLSIAMKTRGVDDSVAKELVDKLEQQTKADIVASPKAK